MPSLDDLLGELAASSGSAAIPALRNRRWVSSVIGRTPSPPAPLRNLLEPVVHHGARLPEAEPLERRESKACVGASNAVDDLGDAEIDDDAGECQRLLALEP